eukprot:gene9131-9299_t
MRPELYDVLPEPQLDSLPPQQQQQQPWPDCAVVQMHYCSTSQLLAMVFGDGSAALYSPTSSDGQLQATVQFRRWLCGTAARATVCKVAAQAQLIALGTAAGSVHLLRLNPLPPAAAAAASIGDDDSALLNPSTCDTLADATQQLMFDNTAPAAAAAAAVPATINGQASAAVRHGMPDLQQRQQGLAGGSGLYPDQLVRTLELQDWGHTQQQTGGVSDLAWAPDCRALAVGFKRQGLVVWTPSGVTHVSATVAGSTGPVVAQLSEELHVMQAADRLLLVTEALTSSGPGSFLAAGWSSNDPSDAAAGSGSDLKVHHVLLPAVYTAANWPLQHVAISSCGHDIAAAGKQGLVVYNRQQEKVILPERPAAAGAC